MRRRASGGMGRLAGVSAGGLPAGGGEGCGLGFCRGVWGAAGLREGGQGLAGEGEGARSDGDAGALG